ncbi:methyltransferase, FkbM family [Pseudomonas sp. ok272]|uniref:FkbM family methyltransferase n=1 Tax=unclassified Pseudomonas TaxID=196821 RepID=UPI0008C08897|nr:MULTISPECIES: FkbM family methyltransferase [unclassified Pseudomonas]SEN36317.1 methyltransferase, FkbM family [Pseudomonas sp. ok272]SFM82630.1 methyltransferase, FkbM family [Pseudomonas sp. ok602]
MTFISYAQNFEDIRLWRALKYYDNGFYIDVGANQPTLDSVTKAFYERGWTGINIEPIQTYYDALCTERPNDINLQCVASDKAQDLTFYAIADTGMSTLEPSVAKERLDAGLEVRSQTVQSRSLSSICEEHVNGPIHFLKIDVEGHEESVLRGMDFTRWRPWIIVIETPWARDQAWEPLVVDAGYQAVLFDGLNTFYLAEEHLHLKGAFDIAPCNLDEFRFCYGHRFSHPVQELEDALEAERERANSLEAQLHAMRNSRSWRAVEKLKKVLVRA